MQATFVDKNFVNLGISQITRVFHKALVSSFGEPILINFIFDQKPTLGSQSPQFSVLKAHLNVGVFGDCFPKLHIIQGERVIKRHLVCLESIPISVLLAVCSISAQSIKIVPKTLIIGQIGLRKSSGLDEH